jgi:hypothetical protein
MLKGTSKLISSSKRSSGSRSSSSCLRCQKVGALGGLGDPGRLDQGVLVVVDRVEVDRVVTGRVLGRGMVGVSGRWTAPIIML